MNAKRKTLLHTIAPIATFLLVFIIWEVIVVSLQIPKWLLPAPTRIFQSMIVNFGDFWPHIWMSFITILLGFLAAIPLAISFSALVTNFVLLSAALTPYVLLLVTTPIITLVPLLMLWMGFGINTRILTVLIQAFAIINLNSCTGFLNVPTLRHELMDTFGASRVQRFFHITLPTALPDVFTGLRLATIFSTTTCISAEYVGGNMGLGSQIIMYSQFLKTTESFACIFYVAIIGLFFYQLVGVAQNLIIRWKI
jgi:NitT/TauT family transport system permease protein